MNDPRRALPSVDRLLREPAIQALLGTAPRSRIRAAAREAVAAARAGTPPADWAADVARRLAQAARPSLRPVLNATGVVLHTNLGRAPLAPAALAAMATAAAAYSNLEFDLTSGSRGSREAHAAPLLAELTGADDALVVNNAAGALVLGLNALSQGREVLISRGELLEIGGGFRIPDILARSGAVLREVGTTNRTHLSDYAEAVSPATGAILTVHRSNFEQSGFVATPEPAALGGLAREAGVPWLHDVGSGLLADLTPWGLTTEPRVTDAVHHGAGVVCFSGDKLLGGPQAGCLVGEAALVERLRSNPLARAFRADKLTLAALGATLELYRDQARAIAEVPVLRMLTLTAADLETRARTLASGIHPSPSLRTSFSTPGGGSFPGARLPTTLVVLESPAIKTDELARRLRLGEPAVVTRIEEDRVVLDPRTLPEEALGIVAAAVSAALR